MKKKFLPFLASAYLFLASPTSNSQDFIDDKKQNDPKKPYKVEINFHNGQDRFLSVYDFANETNKLKSWGRSKFTPDGLADAISDRKEPDAFLYLAENQTNNVPRGKIWRSDRGKYTRFMDLEMRTAASNVLKASNLERPLKEGEKLNQYTNTFTYLPSSIDLTLKYVEGNNKTINISDINKDGIPGNGPTIKKTQIRKSELLKACVKLYEMYREK